MILFVTNNVDSYNNPTINGVLTILEERKIKSVLICKKNTYDNLFQYNKLLEYENIVIQQSDNFKTNFKKIVVYYRRYFRLLLLKFKVTSIIGIDPMGLLLAKKIQLNFYPNIPIDYFSFEIFFKDEFPEKEQEISACSSIRNLIIQDKIRESILKKENLIPESVKSVYIPVAPVIIEKNASLIAENFREIHSIDASKKLIINFGSIEKWSGAELILEVLENKILPPNFVFVIHSRYPLNEENEVHAKLISYSNKNDNLILSTQYINSFNDALIFLKQFDFGMAFYKPIKKIFVGDNIYHIGLASGKFSMYMNANFPTFVSNLPTYANYLKEYKFGFLISEANDFKNINVTDDEYNVLKLNCRNFYMKEIEPESRIVEYLKSINEC